MGSSRRTTGIIQVKEGTMAESKVIESIDNILDSIYESEQHSNAQHEYLAKLKNQISETESKLKEAEKQRHHVEGEVEKKIKRLANREVELLSLETRNKCLQDIIRELKTENANLRKSKDDLQTRLKLSRDELCKQSQELMKQHDFFKRKQPGFKEHSYQNTQEGAAQINKGNGSLADCNAADTNFSSQREEINIANLLWDDVMTERKNINMQEEK